MGERPGTEEIGEAIYTPDEAAALLKMTPRMLADRRRAGIIGSIKDGHYIAFSQSHIDQYQAAHSTRGREKIQADDQEIMVMSLRNAKSLLAQIKGSKPTGLRRGNRRLPVEDIPRPTLRPSKVCEIEPDK